MVMSSDVRTNESTKKGTRFVLTATIYLAAALEGLAERLINLCRYDP